MLLSTLHTVKKSAHDITATSSSQSRVTIVISYLYTKVAFARDVNLLLSANFFNQSSVDPFQSKFSGYTILNFNFNEEHASFTQREIFCN